MNKRIDELKTRCIVREQRGSSAADTYMVDKFDTAKFALLIVAECAEIYDAIDHGNLHMGTDDYLTALRNHFGVKE